MEDRKRQPAIVREVYVGTEDHGLKTVNISLDFNSGVQSFGNLSLTKESSADFVRQVSRLFDVTYINDIVGKKCIALFCFGYYNETIEGIETENGRLTLTAFLRKYNKKTVSPLERAKDSYYKSIDDSVQKIIQASKALESLDERYTDWG